MYVISVFFKGYECSLEEVPNFLPYDSSYICFWHLGGPPCDNERRVCESYVSLRADAEDEHFAL